jgi:hypothetical protein
MLLKPKIKSTPKDSKLLISPMNKSRLVGTSKPERKAAR